MRATSETLAPGSSDAATSRSFSPCDHRRRRSTDVITSAREIVIALLLGLPLGPATLASLKQDGLWRRDTRFRPNERRQRRRLREFERAFALRWHAHAYYEQQDDAQPDQ